MQLSHILRATGVVLAATLCLYAQEQPAPAKETRPNETQGLPPRAAPTDYQSQAKAGQVTIAAEFDGHSVPTEEQTLNTEEFVVVEVALFGPPGARTQISLDDFSLRVNGKKTPVPGLSYVVVFSSLKDPTWVSPDAEKVKESKTSIGGGGGQGNDPPPVIHVPIELQRAMQQHTQKAALPLGDRPLPQAGLLFFQYRGKEKGINSVELIYSGAAGKTTVTLQR